MARRLRLNQPRAGRNAAGRAVELDAATAQAGPREGEQRPSAAAPEVDQNVARPRRQEAPQGPEPQIV